MEDYISVYKKNGERYDKLAMAAALLTNRSSNFWRYTVGETYFDYGQGWKWTTILCNGGGHGGYQALTPKEQEMILLSETCDQMRDTVDEILRNENCPDNNIEAIKTMLKICKTGK